MAFVEETRKAEIDTLLGASKTRNPDLRISADRDLDFKDPSLFLRDDETAGLIVFSKRDTYWEGSFGTFGDDTRALYSVSYIQDFFQKGFDWAATNFPRLPFSCAYSLEGCPWLMELTDNKRDFTVADNVVTAINNIQPNTVSRLNPPVEISIPFAGGVRDLGTIIIRSNTIIIDER